MRKSSRPEGSTEADPSLHVFGTQGESRPTVRILSSSSLVAVVALSLIAGSVAACAPEDEEEVAESSDAVKKGKGKGKGDGSGDNQKLQRFDVIQHNIGGGAENDPGEKGIAYTFSQIDEQNPDVVMLEEVCASQYEAFKARYPSWNVLFAPMRASHPGCANAEAKGQVLASPRPMVETIREDLGDVDPQGDKHFTLLCGSVSMPDTARKVLSCVTHLRAQGNDAAAAEAARGRQVRRVNQLLNDHVKDGKAVVLAGDFNAGPEKDTLDPLYRLTRNGGDNGGLFDEGDQTDPNRVKNAKPEVKCGADACRSGEPTMAEGYAKLDFAFFSHNRVGGELKANPLSSGGSGHRLYKASAQLKL